MTFLERAPFVCRGLIVAGLLGLTGACASRPENVFIPSEQASVPGAARVDMLVATTRKPSSVAGEMFGADRGGPGFAEIEISIPPGHKPGNVEWPEKIPADPAKSFATVKANVLDREQVIATFSKRLAQAPRHSVLLFVHGYNNRFDDAVFRFAQIIHDSGTDAVPVLFTWPSRGELLAYGYDKDSATYSRDALERVLGYLIADKSVSEISIMAHSMGNWVTLETLRQMSIRNHEIPGKIKNIMLADPDVDIDIFRTQVAEMGSKRPTFTVFVSDDDKALAASKILWGSTARLGAINPNAPAYKDFLAENRIDVVNMSEIRTADRMNHGKFSESPEMIQLIGRQLATGQPITDQQVKTDDPLSMATAGVVGAVASVTKLPAGGQ